MVLVERRPFPAPSAVALPVSPSHAMACTVAGRMIAIGAGKILSRIGLNSQQHDLKVKKSRSVPWHVACSGGHDDGIIGAVFLPAQGAVERLVHDIRVAQFVQPYRLRIIARNTSSMINWSMSRSMPFSLAISAKDDTRPLLCIGSPWVHTMVDTRGNRPTTEAGPVPISPPHT